MSSKTKKIAFLGLATAVAIVLSYLEALMPSFFPAVPGIKIGLPNIMIIFLLYKFSLKDTVIVSIIRIFVVALLFGNVMTLAYSIAGAVLSLGIMALLKKIDKFSTVAVSIVGGIAHNLGQIIVAMIVMRTEEIGYYMIVLAVTGTLAGAVIGLAGAMLLKYTKKLKFN